LERLDAVIHLAGESIGSGLWTSRRKYLLRESRLTGTVNLCRLLSETRHRPRLFLAASAVGFYGNRGDEVLTEDSPGGTGFLAELCRDWEAAAKSCAATGMQTVHLRIGPVLSAQGGMLARVLPLFRLGLGGVLGAGAQQMSWISLDDIVDAVCFLLTAERASGSFNLTSPKPVTNQFFTRTLGDVLNRPARLPVPAFLLRLLPGSMADEMLLASTRVIPQRLLDAGFRFTHTDLRVALQDTLQTSST
jgi:uncharacterized protein (TIGR01777 family)